MLPWKEQCFCMLFVQCGRWPWQANIFWMFLLWTYTPLIIAVFREKSPEYELPCPWFNCSLIMELSVQLNVFSLFKTKWRFVTVPFSSVETIFFLGHQWCLYHLYGLLFWQSRLMWADFVATGKKEKQSLGNCSKSPKGGSWVTRKISLEIFICCGHLSISMTVFFRSWPQKSFVYSY